MEVFLVKSASILFYLFLCALLILTFLGLAGNWIIVALALIVKLTGWGDMTWWWFVVIVALAALGEVIEAALGMAVVAKQGGTRYGVVGSFVGGLVGVFVGSAVGGPVGGVVFAFLGAFFGAAIGEFVHNRQIDEAVRVGFWSLVGRTLATMGKVAAGAGMIWIVIVNTW